jgi:hypothetical protein
MLVVLLRPQKAPCRWLKCRSVLLASGSASGSASATAKPPPSRGLVELLAGAASLAVLLAAAALAARVVRGYDDPDAARYQLMPGWAWPVLGLVLVEQVFRNLAEDAALAGQAGVPGAGSASSRSTSTSMPKPLLLGRLDPTRRQHRGPLVTCLVPFLFMAAPAQGRLVTLDPGVAPGVFYSAALLLAGAYLLFMAAVGYYVRYFGGDWGRALQLGLLFAGVVLLLVLVLSASLRAGAGLHRQALLQLPLRLPRRVAAFTAMLSSNSARRRWACWSCARWPTSSNARRQRCGPGRPPTGPTCRRPLEPARGADKPRTSRRVAVQLPARTDLADRPGRVPARPAAYEPGDAARLAGVQRQGLGRHAAAGRRRLLGFVVLRKPAHPVELNWEVRDLLKTASRQAAGYLAQMQATEACWRRASSTPSTACRPSSCTT